MTREEALNAYTRWGAYAGFQEESKGMIKPGYWADLVVLSRDIMKVEPPEILKAGIIMTMVGGRIVYAAGVAQPTP